MNSLVDKYNIPGPRYTSYPTVPYWNEEGFTADLWKKSVIRSFSESNSEEGISIYIHLPFMQIPCDYNGDDINIGFSSKFLTEMLSVLASDDVTMKMSQPNRPGIVEPVDGLEENESILMLSMPVIGL